MKSRTTRGLKKRRPRPLPAGPWVSLCRFHQHAHAKATPSAGILVVVRLVWLDMEGVYRNRGSAVKALSGAIRAPLDEGRADFVAESRQMENGS